MSACKNAYPLIPSARSLFASFLRDSWPVHQVAFQSRYAKTLCISSCNNKTSSVARDAQARLLLHSTRKMSLLLISSDSVSVEDSQIQDSVCRVSPVPLHWVRVSFKRKLSVSVVESWACSADPCDATWLTWLSSQIPQRPTWMHNLSGSWYPRTSALLSTR